MAGTRDPVLHPAVLWCSVGAGFSTLFDSATVAYVAPAAAASLGSSTAGLQWFLASYSLMFGIGLIPGGRLGDAWGRRLLFLAGLGIFLAGGLATAAAPSTAVLIAARMAQGFGAGVLSAQVLGLVQDYFLDAERTRVFAAYTAAGAGAALTGPLSAALLLSLLGDHGWRAVVLVPWISGVITWIHAARKLPPNAGRNAVHVNLIGVVLLTAVVLAALLPTLDLGLSTLTVTALLGSFFPLCALLVVWERRYFRRGRLPLLVPALLRSPRFLVGTTTAALWFGAQLAMTTALVMYLLAASGLAPVLIAVVGVCAAAGRLVGAGLSTGVHARLHVFALASALGVQVCTAFLVLVVTHLWQGPGLLGALCAVFLIHGVASGCTEPVIRAETLVEVDVLFRGVAASFLQLSQRLVASLLAAVTTGMLFAGSWVPGPAQLRHTLGLCVIITLCAWFGSVVLAKVTSSQPSSRRCTEEDPAHPIAASGEGGLGQIALSRSRISPYTSDDKKELPHEQPETRTCCPSSRN